ncbi:MAG: hypothetical protein E7610_00700 [Ruminococcaceae bacterium]|nr:hypothetical protein [Oscillospiraceae bacterium]
MKKAFRAALSCLAALCMATACGHATPTPQPFDSTSPPPAADMPSETEGTSESPLFFQFPLISKSDTTSYVSLPDVNAEAPHFLELFVLPQASDATELVSILRKPLRLQGQFNFQVVAFRNKYSYGILLMQENVYIDRPDGVETLFVQMQCTSYQFRIDRETGLPDPAYQPVTEDYSTSFRYTVKDKEFVLIRNRSTNFSILRRAESMIEHFNDGAPSYEFTILYSHVDGAEVVNTPTEALSLLPFSLFHQYGFKN